MFDVVANRKWFFIGSAVIIVPGLVFLLLGGLKLGIDFTGGSLWEVQFKQAVAPADAKTILGDNGFGDAQVQTAEGNVLQIRLRELKEGSPQKLALENAFRAKFGDFTQLQLQTVGPTVGTSISQRAILAIAFASIGILCYIAYAFRKAQHPFRFGVCAIIAMIHDVFVLLGIFAILGYFFNIEIDSLFVTAVLTVIGFSVHDTIVVFDRVRENTIRRVASSYEEIVNYSLVQTMVRSLNTSLTVVFTLLALYLFGGETIKNFVLALLIGIVSGTYSSIFNASLLLVVWDHQERDGILRRFRRGPATATA
ncbi:MAG: protein translocase subunit SecF [Thermomicrobiales bacterium]|nr:protein translocase subunit SecF [Thermomicrobiales bacterium]